MNYAPEARMLQTDDELWRAERAAVEARVARQRRRRLRQEQGGYDVGWSLLRLTGAAALLASIALAVWVASPDAAPAHPECRSASVTIEGEPCLTRLDAPRR